MSRIGKKPIPIPDGVTVKIEGSNVTVTGPKGELTRDVRPEIAVTLEEGAVVVTPRKKTLETRAFWGLTRALLANMIQGVQEGYEKKLEIEGVGYRANVEGDQIVINAGFSHTVSIKQPEGIAFSVEKNIITVTGIDKELVGQAAAKIRAVRPPEPYKGTGIHYVGEHIRRKEGKKLATAAGAE